jgi:2-polyprenyl-6-methoxyphenol hydroxylase-like FAD-dependent oxidoreductase
MGEHERRGHAVVLGGSIAGLLAARVLADRYERVTIVERDPLDAGISDRPRRGVPQGAHAHGLLAAGLRVIEELFPGATDELVAAGVPTGDVLGQLRFCAAGHPLRQTRVGLTALAASRPYLENYLCGKVAALPGVRIFGGYDVVGVDANPAGTRIVAARVQSRDPGSRPYPLPADLIVDATGRGSRAARWLTELGYPAPAEEKLVVDVGYTSRHYRMGLDGLGGNLAVIIGPTPECPRGAALQIQEHGRCVVTLFGILGDHPPTDEDGFVSYARSLPLPFAADAIDGAEPIDAPVSYRYPASTRYRYDRLRRFPAGFLVTGDALCSFNPMYGQGMSVAAVEALALRDELARGLDARRFFRATRPIIDAPWRIATGGDLTFPGVEGRRTAMTRFVNAYLSRLYAAAEHDEVLSAAFIQVTNLLAAPPSLLRPALVRRVLRGRRAPGAVTTLSRV